MALSSNICVWVVSYDKQLETGLPGAKTFLFDLDLKNGGLDLVT